jgi:hypothetical protein
MVKKYNVCAVVYNYVCVCDKKYEVYDGHINSPFRITQEIHTIHFVSKILLKRHIFLCYCKHISMLVLQYKNAQAINRNLYVNIGS